MSSWSFTPRRVEHRPGPTYSQFAFQSGASLVDLFCYLCLSLLNCHVCLLLPCGHLLGKGLPFGSLVSDLSCVFVTFQYFVLGQEW